MSAITPRPPLTWLVKLSAYIASLTIIGLLTWLGITLTGIHLWAGLGPALVAATYLLMLGIGTSFYDDGTDYNCRAAYAIAAVMAFLGGVGYALVDAHASGAFMRPALTYVAYFFCALPGPLVAGATANLLKQHNGTAH